jgi:hypothetical protein
MGRRGIREVYLYAGTGCRENNGSMKAELILAILEMWRASGAQRGLA